MMRWYGRLNHVETWGKCPRSVLNQWIGSPLERALEAVTGSAWIRYSDVAKRIEVPGGYWETSPATLNARNIEWLGSRPRGDSIPCDLEAGNVSVVRLAAYRKKGQPVVGLYMIPDCVLSVEEIQHALWSQFGSGEVRSEPTLVIASSEKPLPHLMHRCRLASHRQMSLYQCDNPGCAGYRKPLLVPFPTDFHGGNRIGAIAYPCPRCIGSWYERWALTWLRGAEASDLVNQPSVEYPATPTETRRNAVSGPLSSVVQAVRNQEPWGWHPRNIRRLTKGLQRFLKTKKQYELCRAMRAEPEMVGDLLLAVLQRGNLRALVDYVRKLPIDQRVRGIPRAFGHAFCPKRPSAYRVTQESIQAEHHFYIAYSPDLFMGYLDYYGVADCPGTFLDVGSGIGEKPFIAYACGQFSRCDGLEYDARTLAVGQFLLSQLQTEYRYPIGFEWGDALQFDRYGQYDVIYMYRPMRDKAMMRQLFLRIGAAMKIGATCMDVIEKDLAFRRVGLNAFATVAEVGPDGRAVWGNPQSLDDFLAAMGFAAPPQTASGADHPE
ncbi:MAG: hypothetical protein ACK553_09600 [Planctomycetota bacterium]|jgi:hypothetical protein